MAESVQSNQSGNVAPSHAPVPRKKVTVSLTAAQAEKLHFLWQEHSAALHAMLTGWCGDAQNASDMLQEVFRRLAESPAAMTRMKNARAFLLVSARRIAVDFARRSNTRSAYQTAAGAEAPTSENPGPTDENLREVIAKALDGLPADQRSVFEQKILNGRTLDDISRSEGVSLNTVASRLRYALDKIREQLRPYYDDLNRTEFKLMKNDPSKNDQFVSKRIITPLEPKRVPSVAPGLEGLAAMAADDCHADPAPDVVVVDHVDAPTPDVAGGFDAAHEGGSLPEHISLPDSGQEDHTSAVDHADDTTSDDSDPALPACDLPPVDPRAHAAPEHVDPTIDVTWQTGDLSPEDFMATVFEGDTGHETGGLDPVPFDWNSGFEVCVLPMPDPIHEPFDPQSLFADYQSFLSDNPDWIHHNQGGDIQTQVITPSGYFSDLEFGTPGEAAAFDHWFETHCGHDDDPADSGSLLVGSGPHNHGTDVSHGTDTDGDVIFMTKDGSFIPDAIQPISRDGIGQPVFSLNGPGSAGGDHAHADHAVGNVLTLSNESAIESQGGKVVPDANVYHFNPSASHADVAHHADSAASALPVEIATAEVSGMPEAHLYDNAAAGLAPTPGAALIVEFAVLSPSEQLHSHATETHAEHSVAHDVEIDVPHLAAADASQEHASTDAHHDVSASDVSSDAPQHFAAEQHDASPAGQLAHKVDAPTAAVGAVAAGTVVQAGGVAPSVRRPLPKI